MNTLECNYSKKLGLPGYSSHQFSITLRTELGDLGQVQAESARLYRLLQEGVDTSIRQIGYLPSVNGNGNGNGNGSNVSLAGTGMDTAPTIVTATVTVRSRSGRRMGTGTGTVPGTDIHDRWRAVGGNAPPGSRS